MTRFAHTLTLLGTIACHNPPADVGADAAATGSNTPDASTTVGPPPPFPCWADTAKTQPCVPLVDPGAEHLGMFQRGLYPDGSTTIPPAHLATGLAQANSIAPLDSAGNPDATGKYIFITVGFSNQKYEFCGRELVFGDQCDPWTVGGQLYRDAQSGATDPHLVFFNGAQGGHVVADWDEPGDVSWTAVKNGLAGRGYSEAQVQVIALQVTHKNASSDTSLRDTLATCAVDASADACVLVHGYGDILRAARTHYPNLKMVFFNSRTSGAWTHDTQVPAGNPEPFAFESGLAMKWTVAAQLAQETGAGIDPLAGNLGYGSSGPAAWIDWSVYNWANANVPRGDSLTWPKTQFDPDDGIHEVPHNAMPRTCETDASGYTCGEAIAAKPLYDFFTTSQLTRCWIQNTTASCQ